MMRFRFSSYILGLVVFTLPLPVFQATGGETGPRIISLYAAHTEVLLRLGARDNIIGVSRQESYAGPETEDWHPPVFSFRDDVERFLIAKPDIILVRPQHVAGGGRMKAALERAGIRVISMQVVRAEDIYQYWRDVAALVGREAAAETMIAGFQAEIAKYREASALFKNRPGVFLEAVHREIKTFTPDSIPIRLLELAGGRNIAADAVAASPGVIIADYGPERLLLKAGEADLFIAQEGAMHRVPLAEILTRNLYQPLAAFKRGNVHKISEAVLARPTPSLLEGLRQLAEWTGLSAAMANAADPD